MENTIKSTFRTYKIFPVNLKAVFRKIPVVGAKNLVYSKNSSIKVAKV